MQSGSEQLKEWVRRRGFSYAEAADFVGIDASVMTKLCNGTRGERITVQMANKIYRATGIPLHTWDVSEGDDTLPEPVAASARKRK